MKKLVALIIILLLTATAQPATAAPIDGILASIYCGGVAAGLYYKYCWASYSEYYVSSHAGDFPNFSASD